MTPRVRRRKRKPTLTEREREVYARLRAGAPYKTIAYELGIAEGTARVHGSSALRKKKKARLAIRFSANE